MYKNSKIYVAGHTGLLGSALIKALNKASYSNIITRTHKELDLTHQQAVYNFFKEERPEYVFLAAGLTGGIIANKTKPALFLHQNILIQDNIFEAAHQNEVKHLVFYGSSCMYPKFSKQPMKEEYFLTGSIEETSEAYGIAKMTGILACKAYNKQFNTNRFIALIPNSMYGPHDNFDAENSHVLSALIAKFHHAKAKSDEGNPEPVILWGSGNPRREFIYSEDVADASIFAMNHVDDLENHHYNLGSGKDYSIKELTSEVANVVGYTGEIIWDSEKPDGTPKKLLDSSNFLKLGWKTLTTLQEGLRETYQWYLNHIKIIN